MGRQWGALSKVKTEWAHSTEGVERVRSRYNALIGGMQTAKLEDALALHAVVPDYNVYVSTNPSTFPFQVNSPSVGKKDCDVPFNAQLGGKGLILGYDVEAGITGGSGVSYILITGDSGPATEGTLGSSSAGTNDRTAEAFCAD